MIMFTVAGAWAFVGLGRSEDPSFTVKAMLVKAVWPGATIDDTLNLVTDKLEKKLQELSVLDYVKSETKPGKSTIFVQALELGEPAGGFRRLVPGQEEDLRRLVRRCRPGRKGPSSTTSSATPSASSTR